MSGATIALDPAEMTHLRALLEQYLAVLGDENVNVAGDPALQRLVPTPYPDDDSAAAEFRRLTEGDLLARRREDARVMRASLDGFGEGALTLSATEAAAWMRTLAALRLVFAERLGIHSEDDGEPDDPRFAFYDWLGYRLEVLIQALDAGWDD